MKFLSQIDGADKLVEDANNRLVSDSEKSAWNSKSDTDTVTTINGKTGAISKADIVALGIPAKDTTYSTAHALNTGLMGSHLFYPNPEFERIDAKWVHDDTYNLKVNDSIAKLDVDKANKTQVLTDVPANAKFTDTVYTHPLGTNPHGTTKSDVGLENVTNDKQMPISGGVLENYREKLVTLSGTSPAMNLSLGNVFTHTLSGNTTYLIVNAVSGQAHSFTLIITQTAIVRTLTFPASVKWQGGEIPDLSTTSKTYVLTFMTVDGGTTWLGMFGGEF